MSIAVIIPVLNEEEMLPSLLTGLLPSDFEEIILVDGSSQDRNLEGASIHGAQISGTLFPKELNAQEILLSHQQGTRMRYEI